MKHLSTAFLTVVLAIAVNQGGGVTAQDDSKVDQVAEEAKNRAVTIIDGPVYVATTPSPPSLTKQPDVTPKPEQRPPSKPPLVPDKHKQAFFVDLPRPYYGQLQQMPPPQPYPKTLKLHHSQNSVYKFPRVIPLPQHKNYFYIPHPRPLGISASTSIPAVVKSPKFSLPVQTINGIRTDFVRPPKENTTTTSTSTTTETTTTTRALRTKRIWPKRVKQNNTTLHNATVIKDNSTKTNISDRDTSATHQRVRVVSRQTTSSTTSQPTTKRSYRPVTRTPKIKSTTALPANFTNLEPNDWVPIVPSHYPAPSKRTSMVPISKRSHMFFVKPHKVLPQKRSDVLPINKRSDVFPDVDPSEEPNKQMLYLQSFGLVPMQPTQIAETTPTIARKKMVFFKRKRQPNPYYAGYRTVNVHSPDPYEVQTELQTEASQTHPRVVTKIKHHHHHHHHRYVKTVEKKVPYKVEIPKPYPVPVEKKVTVPVEKIKYVEKPVPYPVTVEKKVPFPIGIKVPQPVPVKVVEKEYVPKPYPIVHHVPIVKHVQVKVPQPVPYPVEKRVPYPVKVPVPVDRPVPVAVPVEKKIPYPVKVLVPQPYAVETKVPYPIEVKEPVEVIKHVPIKVPVPQPYAVKVPHPIPVPVEKKVPYPVEVEKKVPVPYEVYVPQKVEVEKKVPVYIPKPYPVERRVPYPVKVPYPVRVPVKVPVEVPIYIHSPIAYEDVSSQYGQYVVYGDGQDVSTVTAVTVTSVPSHAVTVHGNGAYSQQIRSRSDVDSKHSVTTTSSPQS